MRLTRVHGSGTPPPPPPPPDVPSDEDEAPPPRPAAGSSDEEAPPPPPPAALSDEDDAPPPPPPPPDEESSSDSDTEPPPPPPPPGADQSPESQNVVVVNVVSASGLKAQDINGMTDPYVLLMCGLGEKQRSNVAQKTLSPDFRNAEFQFSGVHESEELVVSMFDDDVVSEGDPMGLVRVPVSEMDGEERSFKLQVAQLPV